MSTAESVASIIAAVYLFGWGVHGMVRTTALERQIDEIIEELKCKGYNSEED